MSQVRSPFYYFKFSCVYLFILFTYFCLQKDQKTPNWSPGSSPSSSPGSNPGFDVRFISQKFTN